MAARGIEGETPMAVAGSHRFTVDEFARMGAAGIFTEDDRVELIDGEIRDLPPVGPSHAWIVNRLGEALITRLAGKAYVSVQNPVRLGPHTEPQPDLTVAARAGGYADRHPAAADILLVVEVAVHFDRTEKAPRYAQAGIPEMWLVDVVRGIPPRTAGNVGGGSRVDSRRIMESRKHRRGIGRGRNPGVARRRGTDATSHRRNRRSACASGRPGQGSRPTHHGPPGRQDVHGSVNCTDPHRNPQPSACA